MWVKTDCVLGAPCSDKLLARPTLPQELKTWLELGQLAGGTLYIMHATQAQVGIDSRVGKGM